MIVRIIFILSLLFAINLNANEQNQTKSDINSQSQIFSKKELETTLAPIALYPDSLLAQMLIASTYPEQLKEAFKWQKENKLPKEKAVEEAKKRGWDASVVSLVAFPEVLEMMNKNQKWTKELGEMFLNNPDGVMDTIQELRKKAKEKGNLKSTKEQKVEVDNSNNQTVIKIYPASPDVIYIPFYDPNIIYGSWWYPDYPPYFYYPSHLRGVGRLISFVAVTGAIGYLWSRWDWHKHTININVNYYNRVSANKITSTKKEIPLQSLKSKVSQKNKLRENAKEVLQKKANINLDDSTKKLQQDSKKIKKEVDKVNKKSSNLKSTQTKPAPKKANSKSKIAKPKTLKHNIKSAPKPIKHSIKMPPKMPTAPKMHIQLAPMRAPMSAPMRAPSAPVGAIKR